MTDENMTIVALLGLLLVLLLLLTLLLTRLLVYASRLNGIMAETPPEAVKYASAPLTTDEARKIQARLQQKPLQWTDMLPSRQDRRYIVVGGSGNVGNQIVQVLLAMGHPPHAIRIVDLDPPQRQDSAVPFVRADITSDVEARHALTAPWPHENVAQLPLTIFHAAAVIRPFERNPLVYDRCRRVNVAGTANVLAAAGHAEASIFIYTSDAAVGSTAVDWFAKASPSSPWFFSPEPANLVQVLDGSDYSQSLRPRHLFPSTYARSKAEAERLVCAANKIRAGTLEKPAMRTGAIRPGKGIYGSPGDLTTYGALSSGRVPSFAAPWVYNWVHVVNVALAHVQYEAALLSPHVESISGRPFLVTDSGPALRLGDVHTMAATSSNRRFKADHLPPLLLLLVAHAIEAYCLLIATSPVLQIFFREPAKHIHLLQPSTFDSAVSTIIDDSEARRSPEKGGFGYRSFCTTLEGLTSQMTARNDETSKGAEGARSS